MTLPAAIFYFHMFQSVFKYFYVYSFNTWLALTLCIIGAMGHLSGYNNRSQHCRCWLHTGGPATANVCRCVLSRGRIQCACQNALTREDNLRSMVV